MLNTRSLISDMNPMGTDGFEFVEYTAENAQLLEKLFLSLGFTPIAKHKSKQVILYRQGDVNFIINHEPDSFAHQFAQAHGPGVCSIAFRVEDSAYAYKRAIELGAKPVINQIGPMELNIPAIEGVGGSLIYLVDRYGDKGTIYDIDFEPYDRSYMNPIGVGVSYIDHLTHNVMRGNMDVWADFYSNLFNFQEVRYFDIEGKLTGLKSKAMTSPCGKIRIPINESADDKSQIEEYLVQYKGEGIQHIAMGCVDIFNTVEMLREVGVAFLTPPPDAYYEMLDERLPGHGENVTRMRKNAILMDGAPTAEGGRLLQIFTETVIGPIFFELIQRKGDEGFGEGNFRALFESMERDQVRRGVLNAS